MERARANSTQLSGGAVFGGFVRNIGAVPFNALLFVGIW